MPDQTYGDLIRLDRAGQSPEEVLRRIPLGTPASAGGIDEATLQDLLFRFPRSLPIAAIDAAHSDPVPVCRELYTPAGYVDALYINPLGRLILAEFKLWRNPQARREVIGQILDYAKELASGTTKIFSAKCRGRSSAKAMSRSNWCGNRRPGSTKWSSWTTSPATSGAANSSC